MKENKDKVGSGNPFFPAPECLFWLWAPHGPGPRSNCIHFSARLSFAFDLVCMFVSSLNVLGPSCTLDRYEAPSMSRGLRRG